MNPWFTTKIGRIDGPFGSIPNFTGIGSPYEAPADPDLRLQTDQSDVESLAERVVALLVQRGVIDR